MELLLMRAWLGGLLLLSSMMMACGGCNSEKRSLADASSSTESEGSAQLTPGSPEEDAGGREAKPDYNPMSEIAEGPLNTRIYLQAGRPDYENRHTSTLLVTTKEPFGAAECSALLVSRWVVLTAASCVCRGQKGSACAEHAYASPIVYEQVLRPDFATYRTRAYRGTVRPHPEFQLTWDEQGTVVASRADLAVIVLDEPVASEIAAEQFEGGEAKAGETLVMTGYGYGLRWGQLDGIRFTRRDKVMQPAASGGGRVVYEQQGAFLYEGFHGGPCFREDELGRRLVGVVSVGTEKETAFTSLHPYQDWLRTELQRAAQVAQARQRR
jgi:hypothetical protein